MKFCPIAGSSRDNGGLFVHSHDEKQKRRDAARDHRGDGELPAKPVKLHAPPDRQTKVNRCLTEAISFSDRERRLR